MHKSRRRTEFLGEYAVALVANRLCEDGFSVTRVGHMNLDLLARDPQTGRRLGIIVRAETRGDGKEEDPVNVFATDDREKVLATCEAFGVEPWIAVYVETKTGADLYITSLEQFWAEYATDGPVAAWQTTDDFRADYETDPYVLHLHMSLDLEGWWTDEARRGPERPVALMRPDEPGTAFLACQLQVDWGHGMRTVAELQGEDMAEIEAQARACIWRMCFPNKHPLWAQLVLGLDPNDLLNASEGEAP